MLTKDHGVGLISIYFNLHRSFRVHFCFDDIYDL